MATSLDIGCETEVLEQEKGGNSRSKRKRTKEKPTTDGRKALKKDEKACIALSLRDVSPEDILNNLCAKLSGQSHICYPANAAF